MLVKKNRIAGLVTIRICFVARPGFEPRQTVPKTVVLPLYYRAIFRQRVALKWNANLRRFLNSARGKAKKVQKKSYTTGTQPNNSFKMSGL